VNGSREQPYRNSKKLSIWAEESQLDPNELKKNIFLAKEKYGYIAWH
jgi:hypothetical protein